MNSQNRMNAGAEYVLYRIWGTLRDQNGIHAESLLTCVGALAGYACQMYVRQTAALPGADPGKYALLTVDASDGSKYLHGDALMVPLVESPLSVWALVGRAVQKLDKPLPDIQDIVAHVSQTVGTSAFGVPRAPDGHRPRHPPAVYLTHIWPQILPIAQRFCRKPMQIPVLYGIALQRAIEHTKDMLSPTLSASIAMECAVAMAKMALPEAYASHARADDLVQRVADDPPVTRPTAVATEMDATPRPIASPGRGKRAEPTVIRATRARKRRTVGDAESGAPGVGALVARVPPAARIVTIASLAFMTVAGAMYQADPGETRESLGEKRELGSPQLPVRSPVLAQATQEPMPAQEAQASEEQKFPEEVNPPTLTSEEPPDDSLSEYPELQPQITSDGSDEGLMFDELGQPMR